MRKKALFVLLLALILVLAGCNLVKENVLSLNGEFISLEEAKKVLNELCSDNDVTFAELDEETKAEVRQAVMDSLKEKLVCKIKAQELGLVPEGVSNPDYKSIVSEYIAKDVTVTDAEVEEDYNLHVAENQETVPDAVTWVDYTLLYGQYGYDFAGSYSPYYTPEGIRRVKQILIKFSEEDSEALASLQTADADAEAALKDIDDKIAEAQAKLASEDATDQDKADANSSLEDAQNARPDAEEAYNAAHAAYEEALEAAYAGIDEAADYVLNSLKDESKTWEELFAEKNEDPGLAEGGFFAEKGYPVCEGMKSFDPAFVEAAMALENVGDVSDKVRGDSYGYYIIRYEADETAGAVPLEDVRDEIYDELLAEKKDEAITAQLDAWIAEAKFAENASNLK